MFNRKNFYLAALFASTLGCMACYVVPLSTYLARPELSVSAGRYMSALGFGGLSAVLVARWTAKIPGRFAVALYGLLAALGAGIAYVSLAAPTPNLTTLGIGMIVLGVGQFSLLGRTQARVVAETRPGKAIPYIFLSATALWVALQLSLSAATPRFFLFAASFALLSSFLSLVGPGEPRTDEASEKNAAPNTTQKPNFIAIFRTAPAFFLAVFCASIFASNFYFSECGRLCVDVFPKVSALKLNAVLQISEVATLLSLTALISLVGGLKRAIVAALCVSAARYFLLGFAEPTSAFVAMLGHGVMYVGLQSVVPALYVDRCFADESERKNAQTLLAVAAFAAPSATSGIVAETLERAATNADGVVAWSGVFGPAALVLVILAVFFAIFGREPNANSSADKTEASENADAT